MTGESLTPGSHSRRGVTHAGESFTPLTGTSNKFDGCANCSREVRILRIFHGGISFSCATDAVCSLLFSNS